MPKCEYCGLGLNGMGSVFADSGAGVSIIKCSRCHHYSYFLEEPKVKVAAGMCTYCRKAPAKPVSLPGGVEVYNYCCEDCALDHEAEQGVGSSYEEGFTGDSLDSVYSNKKLASAWSTISNALGAVAPAIATLGIWDLSVAYNTFKKVLENTLRAQQRANNPLYDPFWATAEMEPSIYCGECGHTIMYHTDFKNPGLPAKKCSYHSGPNKICGCSTFVFKKEGFKKKAEEEFMSMPGQEEEGGDEQFSYQTHEVTHDNGVKTDEAMIAISHLENFLRGIIPHVVKYSIQKQDGDILKALGKLGTVIREARKVHRQSQDRQNRDYTRTYLQG